jgi:hypothetical protein
MTDQEFQTKFNELLEQVSFDGLQRLLAGVFNECARRAVQKDRERSFQICKEVYHTESDPWKHSVLIENRIREGK